MCELHYALPRDGAAREQLVGLGYLKSYEGMGRVRVECARGCSSPACRECHPSGATPRGPGLLRPTLQAPGFATHSTRASEPLKAQSEAAVLVSAFANVAHSAPS